MFPLLSTGSPFLLGAVTPRGVEGGRLQGSRDAIVNVTAVKKINVDGCAEYIHLEVFAMSP